MTNGEERPPEEIIDVDVGERLRSALDAALGNISTPSSPSPSGTTTDVAPSTEISDDLGPLGAVDLTELEPADIVAEIEAGGPAFGNFVKAVGLGVAEAQAKLDETLVKTAKALSETKIDVIAVFEQVIDDNGKMTQGNVITQQLPLINYLMPTAYQWSRVYLEANMRVQEFNGTNGFNIQGKSDSLRAGVQSSFSMLGFSGGFDAAYSRSAFQYGTESAFATDTAAGDIHTEATLEPRGDVQLPRPFVLQKGPTLKVTAGAREDITGTGTPPPVTGRRITLTVELRDTANNTLPNKQLEFRISEPLLNYSMTPANGQTDANGKLEIQIRREGAAFDPNRPPEAVTVNVWLGLVNQQVAITI